jgi:hypothetical protein
MSKKVKRKKKEKKTLKDSKRFSEFQNSCKFVSFEKRIKQIFSETYPK